jgi:hypothetical protein
MLSLGRPLLFFNLLSIMMNGRPMTAACILPKVYEML